MTIAPPPVRPALRYMGGKWRIAPRIIALFPPHRTYVEPYGGAASVLLRKPRAFQEVYNDLDGDIVQLFEVMRDPKTAAELSRLVSLTPYARTEFERSYERSPDPIENARRTVVRSFMGFGSTAIALRRRTGFRMIRDYKRNAAVDWTGVAPNILLIQERLAGVIIERRPALKLMEQVDGPTTLIYADPPYVHASRSQKRIFGQLEHAYTHELTDADHAELLAWFAGCRSMVVLSGYESEAYDLALDGWRRIAIEALADGARPRTEVLWINPAAAEALDRRGQHELPLEVA